MLRICGIGDGNGRNGIGAGVGSGWGGSRSSGICLIIVFLFCFLRRDGERLKFFFTEDADGGFSVDDVVGEHCGEVVEAGDWFAVEANDHVAHG